MVTELIKNILYLYTGIHWYKFENDEVERILSGTFTVLCYI